MKRGPIVVADASPLWIRLPFEQLGRHHPTIGLRHDGEISSDEHLSSLRAYREISLALRARTFGRLGWILGAWAAWRIRSMVGKPAAMVYTFPSHRVYPRWFPGIPSFYYASDDYSEDYGFDPRWVLNWERCLLHQVNRVFAISAALADLLALRHKVSREKFTVVPNGLPETQIPGRLPERSQPAPAPVPAHFRPLIGVLGGINKRLRLDWVLQAVEALPWSYWAFVGPIGELDAASSAAASALQAHPRCCFTGGEPYERLFEFAASFDAAVIPLNERGINPTCSPVRFFTQLPYGQPILITPGCHQMQEYSSYVIGCETADSLISNFTALERVKFDDGKKADRWNLAKQSTWECRAEVLGRVIESHVG